MGEKIEYFTRSQIEDERWDDWIKASLNRRMQATSWFLDNFSPGWGALVMDNGNAVMPVTQNRKYGISYLFQPIFVQQLGFFYTDDHYSRFLPEFIEKINVNFRFADISFNEMNDISTTGYQCSTLYNYILRLDRPYSLTAGSFKNNTRRNVIKASRLGVRLTSRYSASEIIRLFIQHNGRMYPNIRKLNYSRLADSIEHSIARGMLCIRAARARNGDIIAAACFLKDFDRHLFYFSANTAEGRMQGAMFMLIDNFIRENSEQEMLLDFNGSMNQGHARFYKGFGARRTAYQRLRINRLMFPVNYLVM